MSAIAARVALHALSGSIHAMLVSVSESLRVSVSSPSDMAWADTLRSLSETEGALAQVGQPGLRVLVRLLRLRLQRLAEGVEVRADLPQTALTEAAGLLAQIVNAALGRLLQGRDVRAADLLPGWQRLVDLTGIADASPAELLSLQFTGSPRACLPELGPVPVCADPLGSAERALLACLRAEDSHEHHRTLSAFADVLTVVVTLATSEDEYACWRVLHAYVVERSQADSALAVCDKKILAAMMRALRLRDRFEHWAVLEPLTRDALHVLSGMRLKTAAAASVLQLFAVEWQWSPSTDEGLRLLPSQDAQTGFAVAVARQIAVLDCDADAFDIPVADLSLWHQLADEARQTPGLLPLAEPLRQLAAGLDQSADLQVQQREWLAALLLGLHAWMVDVGHIAAYAAHAVTGPASDTAPGAHIGPYIGPYTSAIALAGLVDRVTLDPVCVMWDTLFRWLQARSAGVRLTGLCQTIVMVLQAAEQTLELAWQAQDMTSALSVADDALRQVAGALDVAGWQECRAEVEVLRAQLADVAAWPALPGVDYQQAMLSIAQAWVGLSASMALQPLSGTMSADDVAPANSEPVRPDCVPESPVNADPYRALAHRTGSEAVDIDDAEPPEAVICGAASNKVDEDAADRQARLTTIFIEEASGYLHRLRQWAGDPVRRAALAHSTDALRVLHSLAGCASTTGHTALAGLALALETALASEACRFDDLLLADVLAAAEQMLHDIAAFGQCADQPVLLARLRSHMPTALQAPASALPADLPSGLPLGLPSTLPPLLSSPLSSVVVPVPSASAPLPFNPPGDTSAAELQSIFAEEAADLLPQLEWTLQAWQQRPENRDPPTQLLRVLHTLKGSARMAGLQALGDEFHQAEADVATLMREPPSALTQELAALQARIDGWMRGGSEIVPANGAPGKPVLPSDALSSVNVVSAVDADHACHAVLAHPAEPLGPAGRPDHAGRWDADSQDSRSGQEGQSGQINQIEQAAQSDEPVQLVQPMPPAPSMSHLRVAAAQLARVVDASAALWVGNAFINDVAQDQRHAVAALNGDLARLRAQLRELEIESESRILSRATQSHEAGFDPLEFDRYTRLHELTRLMAESIGDLVGVQRGLARQVERLASSAATQARDLRQLQIDLETMRSQPLRVIEPRLRLLLRQAARDTGRDVALTVNGGDVEIERSLLERLVAPLGHLLRNAVVHGIEPPDQRVMQGKPATGAVTVGATIAGNALRLSLCDDGRGLDAERVRSQAIAAGLLGVHDAPDPVALAELIFAPGLSTADEVTTLSGRGIGMDAVRADVQALGGRIAVDSMPGQGCRFSITLPLALASLPVLLARAGARRIALPVARVRQVVQPVPGQIDSEADTRQIVWQESRLPLRHLGQALGEPLASPSDDLGRLPVVIVQDEQQLMALQVDALLGQRDVMVKHPGPQLAQVPGIAGATLLGDGGIVLILDPFRMPPTPIGPAAQPQERPLVLVVDDSLTVRRSSQRLLERHGYAVALARDGVEALERIGERPPMALLLDIEMPRMDGFELLAALRADAALCMLPVLMITSRIADRHRERAQQLGVLAYLGKPFDEDTLLSLLADLRGEVRQAA